ncbi:uncharacterized protein LOC110911173 [Helianthus annuus]|uniref:uncharacterized protein LOC110911173 n=1 Tax=Helianthus annuus TaxID=4232 RepID=UPI000B8F58FF|nr:uncharacterized protein LOC110911173 [Helianthus annuus]
MEKRGITLSRKLRSKVGKGDKTSFWTDAWLGETTLREQFPLIYQLVKEKKAKIQNYYKLSRNGRIWDWAWKRVPCTDEERQQMEDLKERLMQFQLSDDPDVWMWGNEGDQNFTVKSVRNSLANQLNINEVAEDFQWNKWAANKCCLFVWRALQGRIPTATQLRGRGVQIPSVICKLCGRADETPNHLLVSCCHANSVWEQIRSWVKITGTRKPETLKEVIEDINVCQWPKVKKKAVHAIVMLTAWVIWKNRNAKIFKDRCDAVYKLIEEIKGESYQWMRQRTKVQIESWEEWKLFTWCK